MITASIMNHRKEIIDMLEEISRKLIKITKDVVDSTQQQVDVMKMKSSMKKAEAAMENAYKEIGKLFFEKNASEVPGEYAEYVDTVREAMAEMSECKEKIVHINGMQFCKECDQRIKDSMNFCPNCGAKIPELQASADTENGKNGGKQVVLIKAELACEQI